MIIEFQFRFPLGRVGQPWINLVVMTALLVPAAWAQCRESDFAESGQVAAAPSRPNESAAPDPIQTGVVEVETGWSRTWMSGNSRQNVMSNLIKIGAWCNVEIRWTANSYIAQNISARESHGFGDNYLTSQYRFLRESKRTPSVAISYTVKFPSGDPDDGMGSGQRDHLATLMAGKTIDGFNLVSNFSRFWIGNSGAAYDGKYEGTFTVSHALHGKLGWIAEVYGGSRLNEATEEYANSTWGLTYTWNPRLVFDGGAYVSLKPTGNSSNSAFFGATYALGNIYPSRWNPKRLHLANSPGNAFEKSGDQ